MKKIATIFIITVFMISLTGCFSKTKLEEGQSHTTLKEDGEVTLEGIMSDNDAEDDFGIDMDDKEKDIEEDIIEQFDDYGIDVTIDELKVSNDTLSLKLTMEEGDDMGLELEYSLEDYAEDMYYEDIEALADTEDFVLYKNGDDIDEKDLEDYAEFYVISVSGDDEGSYYTVPGKIEALSDIKFENISKDTIFVEDGEYGIIIYK